MIFSILLSCLFFNLHYDMDIIHCMPIWTGCYLSLIGTIKLINNLGNLGSRPASQCS